MGKCESKNQESGKSQENAELCSSEWLYTEACSGMVSEFLTVWVTLPQAKSRESGGI